MSNITVLGAATEQDANFIFISETHGNSTMRN